MKCDSIGPGSDWSGLLGGGVTHVVHLAGLAHRIASKDQVPDSMYDQVNHLATAQLVKAVAATPSVRRFIFVSSIGAVTSASDWPVNEQTPCQPDSAYGRSKLAAENAIQSILGSSVADWCIVRPPLLYGPGNPGNMARLLKLLEFPVPLPLASVHNRRSFLYVGNLVDAILRMLTHPGTARKTFCLGDGQDVSTPDLIRKLGQAAGRPARLFPFPLIGLRLLGSGMGLLSSLTGRSFGLDLSCVEKFCSSLPVDSSHFCTTCAWTPPFTMDEGLRATVSRHSE
jgi:nucleoside-diphosphate-sugar epimerase